MDEEFSCHKGRSGCEVGYCSEVYRAFEGVKFIAESTRREQDTTRVSLSLGHRVMGRTCRSLIDHFCHDWCLVI